MFSNLNTQNNIAIAPFSDVEEREKRYVPNCICILDLHILWRMVWGNNRFSLQVVSALNIKRKLLRYEEKRSCKEKKENALIAAVTVNVVHVL